MKRVNTLFLSLLAVMAMATVFFGCTADDFSPEVPGSCSDRCSVIDNCAEDDGDVVFSVAQCEYNCLVNEEEMSDTDCSKEEDELEECIADEIDVDDCKYVACMQGWDACDDDDAEDIADAYDECEDEQDDLNDCLEDYEGF